MKKFIGVILFSIICFGSAIASHIEYKERIVTYGEVAIGQTYWHKSDRDRICPLIKGQDSDCPLPDDFKVRILDEVTVLDPVTVVVEKTYGDLSRWTTYYVNPECTPPCYIKKAPNCDLKGVTNDKSVWVKETRYE